ncbi:MAG: Trm112 family protein [Chloroflexi bacterium]|nr:Trm112 family protein [Chloroflexota bacterium]
MKKRILLSAIAVGVGIAAWLRLRGGQQAESETAVVEPPAPLGQLGGEVDSELLAILACPLDKAPVAREGDYIVCSQCGRRYPIRDGIPVMLIEEALLPESAPGAEGQPAPAIAGEAAAAEPPAQVETETA